MAFQGELPSGSALFPNPQQNQQSSVVSLNGTLVLYKTKNRSTTPIWSSRTNGRVVSRCEMQADGNLVIYTPEHTPIFASDTPGHNGSHLEVQDDGNMVIYTPDHTPLWATGTQGS
jgi:hypothetical protein